MVISLAVLGLAGGAYLAFATVPSFAPYVDRRRATPVVINGPIAGDRSRSQDAVGGGADRYGLAAARPQADEGFSVRPGPQDGTIVLQLPRWAENTAQWYGFGERALQEWRAWTGSDESRTEPPQAPGYGRSRDWRRQSPSLGMRGFHERYDQPADRDGDDGYAEPERWSDEAPQYIPSRRDERGHGEADASAHDLDGAAERARDAARDVRDAERDPQ